MKEKDFFFVFLLTCDIISDYSIYNNLRNKSSDILFYLFIKQLISYITMVIIGYINVKESGGGDRTMGAGLGLFVNILCVPILFLLVDGFTYSIFWLTNSIIIYWILYLLNICLDCICLYILLFEK